MGKTAAQVLIEEGIKRGIEQGIERGIEQGRRQGIVEGKQENLLELMKVKFHSVPKNIEDRIKTIQDIDELTSLLRRGLTAKSIDEMGIG